MTVQDDRTGHDALTAGIAEALACYAENARDWEALENASRKLILGVVRGDGHSVVIPTQRTDAVEDVLARIDRRRHP